MTSFAIKLACFAVGASLGAAVPASAEGNPTDVVPVHQDLDGSLWYSYDDVPGIKVFITGNPCWIDHDHIRFGTTLRTGCAASRP